MPRPVVLARLADPAWLRAQLEELAGYAEDDASSAEAVRDKLPPTHERRARMEERVDLGRHYAQQLRRVLKGKTFEEGFLERLRQAAEAEGVDDASTPEVA